MNRSLFLYWGNKKNSKKNFNNTKTVINFGPQHPAAHGVLRLVLGLEGEVINRTDAHIGLLHRGTEKLIEEKHYEKSIPYFDRLDYVSMSAQEHAYCLAIEYIQNIKNLSIFTNTQRVLFDELTRLLNHFLAIACHALDVGSMSSIFWAFEEREKIMEFYERVSGARMHIALHKPQELFSKHINNKFLEDISYFVKNCQKTLNEMHNILSYNKIWKQRLVNVGTFNIAEIKKYGLTGVMARCVGVKRDLRISLKNDYSGYGQFVFKSYVTLNGDSYDRYLIRMFEMTESLSIVNQCVELLSRKSQYKTIKKLETTPQIIKAQTQTVNAYKTKIEAANPYNYMEDLIEHFVKWHTGLVIKKNIATIAIESPKGEFGVSLVSDNGNKPYRCKIRSPGFHSLQFLPKMTKGHLLGDLATIIGTIDIVFGEIDR